MQLLQRQAYLHEAGYGGAMVELTDTEKLAVVERELEDLCKLIDWHLYCCNEEDQELENAMRDIRNLRIFGWRDA